MVFWYNERVEALNISFENTDKVVQLLKNGKVGVMPTDTIYGIVGSALNPEAVENIYKLRSRTSGKPMIILISGLDDLNYLNIELTKEEKNFLKNNWPNPLSVVLSCPSEKFKYLHRGKKSLAFRMPDNEKLLGILKQTGPLVAPSANFEKEKPSETVSETKKYFGENIAFYVDGGILKSKPSTIVRLYKDGTRIILREGGFPVTAGPS